MLNILAGLEDYQGGTISFKRDLRIAYLDQNPDFPKELSVIDACLRSDNEAVRTIAAVSYTHLDVYKRQGEPSAPTMCSAIFE